MDGRKHLLHDELDAEVASSPDDATFLMISYDPARTDVESVMVGESKGKRVAEHTSCFVVEAKPAGGRVKLKTEYTGLVPKLLEAVQPVAAGTVEEAVSDARRRRVASIRRTLLQRVEEIDALDPGDPHARFRRFFLSFDALTLVEVMRHVAEGELFGEPELASVFLPDRIRMDPDKAAGILRHIKGISGGMAMQWVEDAMRAGLRLHSSSAEDLDLIELRIDRAKLFSREDVELVALYLLDIFSTEFEISFDAGGELDPDLKEAFTLFANGQLVCAGAEDRNIANGKPNSAMFLGFGEFALAACTNAALIDQGQQRTWTELARLFVALQEVFLTCYGPRAAPRTHERYQPARGTPELPARSLSESCLTELLEHYRRLPLEALTRRHLEHIYWVNRDHSFVIEAWLGEPPSDDAAPDTSDEGPSERAPGSQG